jgi:two-component system, LuxR family, sensor kinase FixL
MITGLAHESRNALQRTHACLELLILKVEQRPELLALVQDIQKAQDYLVHMYEEVRSYAAPMKLRREKLNLDEVLQETWAHLEAERKGRTATLVKEPCPSIRDFRADPLALNQVFRNILENSLSVCADPVILRAQWTEKLVSGQVYVEITFRDNGPGFPPTIRDKVFEPFFTTKTRGTGLGLAIAKRIVEAHGGRIEIGRSGHPGAEIVLTFLKETS